MWSIRYNSRPSFSFKVVEFDIMYGQGISKTGELLDLGVKAEIVEKAGSCYSYNGERLGQGREGAKTFLKENPDVANRIESAVREKSGLIAKALEGTPEPDADGDSSAA